jgi:hypothetical protein
LALTLCYSTGEEARVGDRVEYHGEPSIVDAVIDNESAFSSHNVGEFGLFLTNESFGLVFEPLDGSVLEDCVVFVSRSP